VSDDAVVRGAAVAVLVAAVVGGRILAARASRRPQSLSANPVAHAGATAAGLRLLSNAELTEADLPASPDEWFQFALSFNGYQHWGSFEKCAAAASRARREEDLDKLNMTGLRTELFFLARMVHHSGEDLSPAEMARARKIVDAIGNRIRSGATA
jgi:hypothetical protein